MIAHVALPYSVSRLFSYKVPKKWQPFIFKSQRVIVPFRERKIKAYVVALEEGEDPQLKEILEPVDIVPHLPNSLLDFIEWMRDYFVVPYGVLLKYALSDFVMFEDFLEIETSEDPFLDGMNLQNAYKKYGKEKVFSLFFSGRIKLKDVFFKSPYPVTERKKEKQISRSLRIEPYEERLKAYLNAIDGAIKNNENCLFFVPPFSLSGKLIYDFLRKHYPECVFWYGKEIRKKERAKIHFALRNRAPYIVLSNIAGLFLPISKLGLIIVERPEDESYTINTRFSINVAESALKRSEMEGISILVGSASPPLSFIYKSGFFTELKEEKIHNFFLHAPLSQDKPDEEKVIQSIKTIVAYALKRKESIAIFTPRKHYSGRLFCMECKKTLTCSRCGAFLCLSKKDGGIVCPQCEENFSRKEATCTCGSFLITMRSKGAEFIKEILEKEIGSAKVQLVTSETINEEILNQIEKPFVFLGSKVLSFFYNLNAENLIIANWKELKRIWNYKAYEKIQQLFINLLDALKPKNIFILDTKIGDFEKELLLKPALFRKKELKKRIELNFPPAKRLVMIQFMRKDKEKLEIIRKKLEEYLRKEGLSGHIYGHKFENSKGRFLYKVVLSGLSEMDTFKLFPLFDLYGVNIKVDPESF